MTKRIHTNGNYTNVGMLEILNEPLQDTNRTQTMISEYYPNAYKRIWDTEEELDVDAGDRLHVQMMVSFAKAITSLEGKKRSLSDSFRRISPLALAIPPQTSLRRHLLRTMTTAI